MSEAEALETLRQRRRYLVGRVAWKRSIGWETVWDEREWEALGVAIMALGGEEDGDGG